MKNLSRKGGFSLIEISIVLIIVGLLIAGITGGAALIKSAELRSVMSEARGFQTSVNAFYVNTDSLPGDYNVSLDSSGAGNANDQIEYANNENKIAFDQMVASGVYALASGVAIIGNSSAASAGTDTPGSKVKFAGWSFDYITIGGTAMNGIFFHKNIDTAVVDGDISGEAQGALSGTDALSVDTKIDDGAIGTGTVRSMNGDSVTCTYGSGTADICVTGFRVDVVL